MNKNILIIKLSVVRVFKKQENTQYFQAVKTPQPNSRTTPLKQTINTKQFRTYWTVDTDNN